MFLDEFLTALTPADALFQSHEISYNNAMNVIQSVKDLVAGYRTDNYPNKFDEMMSIAENLIEAEPQTDNTARPTRDRRRPSHLDEFIVEESIGVRSDGYDEIRSCFHQTIDVSLAEFDQRFTENNEILLALSNSPNMELEELKPLEKIGVVLPPVHEMETAKRYIESKKEEWSNSSEEKKGRFNILSSLYEVREAFPEVYKLYAIIDTFACSTAICEGSFSALAQINIPPRISMTNERMRNLAFIAFEHKRLKNISIDDILKEFHNRKDRKVQLF